MGYIDTTITIEQDLLEKAEKLARTLKVPRSQLFRNAIQEYLLRKGGHQLLDDINQAYKKSPTAAERAHLSRMKTKLRRRVVDKW
ncbi:MAG: hypothetical protein NPIRA02_14360 [Nitrospirales bacterium]|nr:MAG: hypothetical protein NPIRA02_14360 [Nitrospirales bacterium]